MIRNVIWCSLYDRDNAVFLVWPSPSIVVGQPKSLSFAEILRLPPKIVIVFESDAGKQEGQT